MNDFGLLPPLEDAIAKAKKVPGWMGDSELEYLAQQAAFASTIVEIGTFMGRSAKCMANVTRGQVFCVDSLRGEPESPLHRDPDELKAEQRKHLGPEVEANKVVLIHMSSTEAAAAWQGPQIDFLWIDGGHEYPDPLNDLEAWWPHLREDARVAGHDRQMEGVQKSLTHFGKKWENGPSTIWVLV